MAKCTVIFEDIEGGGVDVRTEFEPDMEVKNPTPAQAMGFQFLQLIESAHARRKRKTI